MQHASTLTLLTLLVILSACDGATQTEKNLQQIKSCPSNANTSKDGEGCASIDIDHVIAGEKAHFVVEFVVGNSGIAVGGGIALGIHHGGIWFLQTENSWLPNYVDVESAAEHLAIEIRESPRKGMFEDNQVSLNANAAFHRLAIVDVKQRPLLAGTVVRVIYGANLFGITAPKSQDLDHEIRVTTDIDGDGVFAKTVEPIVFSILPDEVTQLSATAPSQVKNHTPFELLIRAEDSFYNTNPTFTGPILVRDEHGTLLAENITLQDGLARIMVSLDREGPHRLRLSNDEGDIIGRSNPLMSMVDLPQRRLFWADLHGHTGVSDGLGRNANEYFEFGRNVAKLDIIALTDHGHFDWPANIKAVQEYYEPGRFVTILAQEAGARTDHMNLYFRADNEDHISRWQKDYGKFQQWVYQQYNREEDRAMTGPHHFAYGRNGKSDERYPFGLWDSRVARLVEVYSSHGTSEYMGNPRPLKDPSGDERKYLQHALTKGHQFAVIGASDNHDSRPGRSVWGQYAGGLAGVWATSLDRESVWNALWTYSTYATSIDRIYMDFSINGKSMGQTINASEVRIEGYIIGKTDELEAHLIRNNVVIQVFSTDNGVISIAQKDMPDSGKHFYYLRVIQGNGERAWSTPVWVNKP